VDHANRRQLVRFQRCCPAAPRTRTRIKDQNIGYIAEYLTALDIDLKEVVGDEERAIIDALNALRTTSLHLCLHHRRDRADPR
jgi:hypothetical protein